MNAMLDLQMTVTIVLYQFDIKLVSQIVFKCMFQETRSISLYHSTDVDLDKSLYTIYFQMVLGLLSTLVECVEC
jgi:hypothetical protein